jgi:predicted ATPase
VLEDIGRGAAVSSPGRAWDLYGRDSELALLSGLLDRATTGIGGARIVRGDAGIGKSALLEAVVERAGEGSMTVHSTRGVQSEASLPFAGLHQVLAPLLPRLDELGVVQQRTLLAAFGLVEAACADPFRIALVALELLTNAASDGPLLIVADDAQLLDTPTIDVLTFVARRLAADPIVALFAVRGEAIANSGLDELHLAPLDDAASAALLRQHHRICRQAPRSASYGKRRATRWPSWSFRRRCDGSRRMLGHRRTCCR